MHRYLLFAVGLLVLVAVFAPSLDHLGVSGATSAPDPSSADGNPPEPAAPGNSGGGGMTITRDGSGQFHLVADVNGHPVSFLVDTGADSVALSEADAQSVGLSIDPSAYTRVANTASGPGYGAHVRLDRIEIGGQDLSGVDAVVLRGLRTSLLGQSVLRRIGSVSINGDAMVIGR